MRTPKQISQEIRRLRNLKPTPGRFEKSTQERINLAIEELTCGIDQTAAEFSEMDDSSQDIIRQTFDWKNGYTKHRPSYGWGQLVQSRAALAQAQKGTQ